MTPNLGLSPEATPKSQETPAPPPVVATGASVGSVPRLVPASIGPVPMVRPTELKPLDSKTDTEAIIRALKADGHEVSRELVEHSRESWLHPKLAEWGKEQGFVSYKAELKLDTRVGHFDHSPYAMNSMFGPAVATPYQTEQYGQVFFVEWNRQYKASQIAQQVAWASEEFESKAILNPYSRHEYPKWIPEVRDRAREVVAAFGLDQGWGNSREWGNNLILKGTEALKELRSPALEDQIKATPHGTPEQRDEMVRQVRRLDDRQLDTILRQTQVAWNRENDNRDHEREARRARYALEEANADSRAKELEADSPRNELPVQVKQ